MLVLLFIGNQIISQTINQISIGELDKEYIELTKTTRVLTNTIGIDIDWGQKQVSSFSTQNRLRDEAGPLILNSIVEALNLFDQNGYELFQIYVEVSGTSSTTHYLLKRKKKVMKPCLDLNNK